MLLFTWCKQIIWSSLRLLPKLKIIDGSSKLDKVNDIIYNCIIKSQLMLFEIACCGITPKIYIWVILVFIE